MPVDELIEYEPDAEGTQETSVDDEVEDALEIPSAEEVDQEIEAERAADEQAKAPPEQPAESPELAQLRARAERASQLEQAIQAAAQQQQQQQSEAAFEEDPAAALKQEVDQLKAERTQEKQQQYAAQVYNHAVSVVGESEKKLIESGATDYHDKLDQARDIRARLTKATHPDWSEQQVAKAISDGDRLLAFKSLQQGRDPAAVAYEMSKRMIDSMQPGQPTGQPAQQAAAGWPQAQPAGRPASPPPRRPIQTSLSAAHGRNVGGRKVTMEQAVNETTDEEFDSLFQDPRHARNLSDHGFTVI